MNNTIPSFYTTLILASLYVTSGVIQPLIMEIAKQAGLTDNKCQIYMFAYYLGTASVCLLARNEDRLSLKTTMKTASVAIDIIAQTLNYTGMVYAGPTLFAIIYSSVTIWTALLSSILLNRQMTYHQWISVVIVFIGLGITGLRSLDLGPDVVKGTCLISIGSALHACMYVLSEKVMNNEKEVISAQKYCAVYGSFACSGFFIWQLFYTRLHFNDLILEPMQAAGTSIGYAIMILFIISFMSAIHSATFFHSVKYLPGGATSAGVLKALQAVLVFAATSLSFCVESSPEMCFDYQKMLSLCVVVSGVILFGKATNEMNNRIEKTNEPNKGYRRVKSISKEVELEATRDYHQV